MTLPADFEPEDEQGRRYHTELAERRNKTYAHTDRAGGRSVTMNLESYTGGVWRYAYREEWLPLSRDGLPLLVAFFEQQADRFRKEASFIQWQLDGGES